jgi:uncharacterized protein (DUF1501 family)
VNLQYHVNVRVNRERVIQRRDVLKLVPATAAAGMLGWHSLMTSQAAELRQRGMSCILLWMQGGPSQFETLDPKPGHANGGETKAINTNVSGIQLAENLPNLAKVADQLAVIRSVTSREGAHPRATSLMHTGYLPTASVKYPTIGAIAAKEIPHAECELPAFVQVGGGRGFVGSGGGGGFLGVEYNPFLVQQAGQLPQNTQVASGEARYRRRLGLLDELDAEYAADGGQQLVEDHKRLYDKTAKMILSPQMKAFELDKEPAAMRDGYGRTPFGNACLLARRLVETGVTFVEVTAGNWDTHDDNFNRVRTLTGTIDKPFAQLVSDLKQRGLLETTLVIWMGEFGRTPRINARSGRDHFPRAFSVALAGGGVRGGRLIGKTSDGGDSVVERPVTVNDLFQTFCKSLKISASKENMSGIGRPIKIVDGGQPVNELFT